MTEKEFQDLQDLFFEAGYLVGKTNQRDIMFKYTVPIDVQRVMSFTVMNPQSEQNKVGIVNPSGVAYTYEFRNSIEDCIQEVLYDGSLKDLFRALKENL
ncbi:hypothetical protein N1495_00210 [Streptococcus didelphis]|uniref:Uncharacterized protein n=1 Tax=Streptococcus didelphis TaxID=102886 RepID=A0ABY9LIK3_9STRE|nr:hypothetical protein [Streptococcus didelphis]WMB27990.1 hypothetical protein N1496_08355 [Streptococcus didelphis]WMB29542.1 hypothetical protein N1495_00210 [Streptococcus didelphis]